MNARGLAWILMVATLCPCNAKQLTGTSSSSLSSSSVEPRASPQTQSFMLRISATWGSGGAPHHAHVSKDWNDGTYSFIVFTLTDVNMTCSVHRASSSAPPTLNSTGASGSGGDKNKFQRYLVTWIQPGSVRRGGGGPTSNLTTTNEKNVLVLSLKNVTREDSGLYKCEATGIGVDGRERSISQTIRLFVMRSKCGLQCVASFFTHCYCAFVRWCVHSVGTTTHMIWSVRCSVNSEHWQRYDGIIIQCLLSFWEFLATFQDIIQESLVQYSGCFVPTKMPNQRCQCGTKKLEQVLGFVNGGYWWSLFLTKEYDFGTCIASS